MSDYVFMICCILALLILVGMIVKTLVSRKKLSLTIKDVLIASFFVVFILILPQYLSKEFPPVTSAVFSFLYSLKSLSYGQSWETSRWIVPGNGLIRCVYYSLLYTDFIAIPIITMSLLVSLFGDYVDKIKLFWLKNRNKNIIVFSSLNDSSAALASSMDLSAGDRVVFCGYDSKKQKESRNAVSAKKISCLFTQETAPQIPLFRKAKKLSFYLISKDTNKNLLDALAITDLYNKADFKHDQVEINLFASGHSAEAIMDSVKKEDNKGNKTVNIKIIDETKYSCYELLFDTPLYSALNNKISNNNQPAEKLSLLIVGCGNTGLEMVKAAVWCGQMSDVALEINVIDKKKSVQNEFELLCPELTADNGYNIHFYDCDVTSKAFYDVLNANCKSTSYVVVGLRDDDLGIETGIRLREYYLRTNPPGYDVSNGSSTLLPVICVRVRDEQKSKAVDTLEFDHTQYRLKHFGSVSEIYNAISLSNSTLDFLSKCVHVSYTLAPGQSFSSLSDREFEEKASGLYSSSYNQRSSLATAIHVKYKLYSLFGKPIDLENVQPSDILKIRKATEENIEKMAELEHRRWNAYLRSEGFMTSSKEQVASYLQASNLSPKYVIGRVHPALVEWEKLDTLYDELKGIPGIRMPKSFKESDRSVCRSIPDYLDRLRKEKESS